jgi:hypothetical protein
VVRKRILSRLFPRSFKGFISVSFGAGSHRATLIGRPRNIEVRSGLIRKNCPALGGVPDQAMSKRNISALNGSLPRTSQRRYCRFDTEAEPVFIMIGYTLSDG